MAIIKKCLGIFFYKNSSHIVVCKTLRTVGQEYSQDFTFIPPVLNKNKLPTVNMQISRIE